VNAYVGIPFTERGRTRAGADCWGLVRLVYEDRGISLPSLSDTYASTTDRDDLNRVAQGTKSAWHEIPYGDEEPYDIVLMAIGGRECHVGIVTEPGKMLHTERGHNAVIESYERDKWSKRVQSFWRWGARA
jgi:cell wall-associated NlpC family hydrolase